MGIKLEELLSKDQTKTLKNQVPDDGEPRFVVDLLGKRGGYKIGPSTVVWRRWSGVTRIERFNSGAIGFMNGELRVTIVPGGATVIIEEMMVKQADDTSSIT
jgi:hypothetical protein